MIIEFVSETPKGKTTWVKEACQRYPVISCSYPCTEVNILPKNPTNALVHFHFFGFLSVQYLNYISVFQLIALN